jgi:hypothetical protein
MFGWVAIPADISYLFFLTVTLDSSNTSNVQLGSGLAYTPTREALHYLLR